jgi:very-short-patch-repair endonuclease
MTGNVRGERGRDFVLPYSAKLKMLSQQLRDNMTDAEKHLWSKIRLRQIKGFWFYRQKPIGGYIIDFYCPKAKMIIEVDGGQHFEYESVEYDKVRDEYMESAGLKVLRFTNTDVMSNIEGVIEIIMLNLP